MSAQGPLLRRLPNALSWFRIGSVPVALLLAAQGLKSEFLMLFSLAMISDFLDGFLARRLGVESAFGAVLDSVADLLTYFSLPINLWLLWPAQVEPEWAYIAVGIGCYLAPILVSFAKFRRFPSFHTWSAKTGGVLALPVLIAWIGFDRPEIFHLFVYFQLWVSIEQLWMIALLQEWSCNVPSVFTLLARRRPLLPPRA